MSFNKKNILNKFNNFILSNFKTDDYDSTRKVIMVNSFFLAGMLAFFFFSVIHTFLTQKFLIALLDIVTSAIFLFAFLDLKKNKNIYKASIIGLILLIVFVFIFSYLNHNQGCGLIWTIFVPLYAIFIFGSKTGFKISLIYYTVLLSFLLYGALNWNEVTWNIISFSRLLFASVLVIFIAYITENSFEKLSIKLKKSTNTDALTNLYNRRKIDEIINNKLYDFNRYNTKLCIAILDIDDFKKINDNYGHAIGDEVLIDFAKILQKNSRENDLIGRWGGEEFIFIMQNIELKDSVLHMNRVRNKISLHKFSSDIRITCSIGVSQANKLNNSADKLFKCADTSLYTSKHNGKNLTSYNQ